MSDKPTATEELGALWCRTSHRGDYMTGVIGGVKVVCFRIDKKSDKQPDWRVIKSVPREDRGLPKREAPEDY